MSQHDRDTTRHIVTDAEAGHWRRTYPLDPRLVIHSLLDTREELKEALEACLIADETPYGDDTFLRVGDLLSRLRGEA